MADTLIDGSYIWKSYTWGGLVFQTFTHDKPVTTEFVRDTSGLHTGSGSVKDPEQIDGVLVFPPASEPAQLVASALVDDDGAAALGNWFIASMQIDGGVEGLRKANVTLIKKINP